MPGFVAFLVGLALIGIEGVVLAAAGATEFAFQFALAMTVYLGLRREFVGAAWILVALLLPTEWMVSGPVGLYSLGLVVLFAILRGVRVVVSSGTWLAESLVGFCAVFVHGLVMVFVLLMTTPHSPIIPAILWQLPFSGLVAAVVVPLLLRGFDRVDERLRPAGGLRINA